METTSRIGRILVIIGIGGLLISAELFFIRRFNQFEDGLARRTMSLFQGLRAGANVVYAATKLLPQSVPQETPEPPKVADYEDADGYVVLSILLSHAHSEVDPSFLLSPFLLSPLSVSGISADSFQSCNRVPTDFASAAADFRDENKQNWNLTKKINLKFNYKFTNLAGKHGWVAPTQNAKDVPPALFETPVYQVSAVGFDAPRTHAIAYVGAVCGPDCGSGSYHLLVKEKEGWKETTGSPVCHWMK